MLGVAVVDFHHQVGPQVEWVYPHSLSDDTELMNQVPFYALPDGSHQSHEGLCLFHLAAPHTRRTGTVYGLACNRQVDASQLTVRDASMTRATVQKAVVVLASAPVFAPVKQKLAIITRVYLSQGDLTDRTLLTDFAISLEEGLCVSLRQSAIDARVRAQSSLVGLGLSIPSDQDLPLRRKDEKPASLLSFDATLSMGTNLRQFLYEWRTDLLVLLKLLLLQRRVMVFGYPTEALCGVQYDLISLVPGLLAHLDDCAQVQPPPESVAGNTLPLFSGNAVFHPYLPLQEIGLLQAQSWLVGTSNSVMLSQQDTQMDVLVNLESKTIDFCGSPEPACRTQGPASVLPSCSSSKDEHHGVLAASEETLWGPSGVAVPPLARKPTLNRSRTSHKHVMSQASRIDLSERPELTREELQAALQLTPADKRWMEEEIIPALLETWDEKNPSRAATLTYRGSDDWLRAQFQGYIARLLASVARAESGEGADMKLSATMPNTPLANRSPKSSPPVSLSRTSSTLRGKERRRGAAVDVAHFGQAFVCTLQGTLAYRMWRKGTVTHGSTGHPFQARLSVLEGVSARLAPSLDESRTSTLGKGLATASSAGLRWFASALGQGVTPSEGVSGKPEENHEVSRPILSPSQGTNQERPAYPSHEARMGCPISSGNQASPSPLSAARAAWGSMGTYLSSWGPVPTSNRSAPPTPRAPRRQATAPLPQGETDALVHTLVSGHQRTTSTTCFPSAPFSAPTAEERKFVPPLARWRSQREKENSHTHRRSQVGPLSGLSGLG